MSFLGDREKGHEGQFAHEQDLEFRALAHRDKLLAEWVAGHLGLKGAEVDKYVTDVIQVDIERPQNRPGEEEIFEFIRKEFDEKGVDQSDHQIRRTMEELLEISRVEIRKQA